MRIEGATHPPGRANSGRSTLISGVPRASLMFQLRRMLHLRRTIAGKTKVISMHGGPSPHPLPASAGRGSETLRVLPGGYRRSRTLPLRVLHPNSGLPEFGTLIKLAEVGYIRLRL
jgi:hypothetical protein